MHYFASMRVVALVLSAIIQSFGYVAHLKSKSGSFCDSDGASLLQVELSKRSGNVERAIELHSRGNATSVTPEESALDGGAVMNGGNLPPSDWLFGFGDSTSCSGFVKPAWDTTTLSFTSRVFLPMYLFAMTCCALAASAVNTPEIRDDTIVANRPRERRLELDFARVVCVACVVVEHSGGKSWTRHNVLFVLQWVLPYLYMTSGTSFMMSQKTMMAFNLRLGLVLAIGVAANWVSDMLTGRDWQHDFGNTVFQMFYVVMLIVMSTLASPLRHVLQYSKDATSIALWGPTVIYGLITACSLCFFIIGAPIVSIQSSGTWLANAAPLLNNAPIALIQVGGIIFLCHLACFGQPNDLLAWVLLAYIYIPRVVIPWEKVGFAHNLELFVFAMVVESWKIRGSKTIQRMLRSYWPILLFAFMLTHIPDFYGRCDVTPPNTTWERARFYSIEFFLVLCLSARAFQVDDPFEALPWLNYWALYAYCFHVCWARLFPLPYGCVFTFSSVIMFYGLCRVRSKGQETKEAFDRVGS